MKLAVAVGCVLAGILFPSLPTQADITVRQYFIWKNGSDHELRHIMTWYFVGIVQGVENYGRDIVANGQKPLFCPPPQIRITKDRYLDILRRYLDNQEERLTLTTGEALLRALKQAFPC